MVDNVCRYSGEQFGIHYDLQFQCLQYVHYTYWRRTVSVWVMLDYIWCISCPYLHSICKEPPWSDSGIDMENSSITKTSSLHSVVVWTVSCWRLQFSPVSRLKRWLVSPSIQMVCHTNGSKLGNHWTIPPAVNNCTQHKICRSLLLLWLKLTACLETATCHELWLLVLNSMQTREQSQDTSMFTVCIQIFAGCIFRGCRLADNFHNFNFAKPLPHAGYNEFRWGPFLSLTWLNCMCTHAQVCVQTRLTCICIIVLTLHHEQLRSFD